MASASVASSYGRAQSPHSTMANEKLRKDVRFRFDGALELRDLGLCMSLRDSFVSKRSGFFSGG